MDERDLAEDQLAEDKIAEDKPAKDAPVEDEVADDEPAEDDEPAQSDDLVEDKLAREELAKERAAPARPERKFWKILRVVAYAAFVCSVAGAIAILSAYDNMKESALEIGDELGKLGDVGNNTPILLNGQRIHVGSSVHELSVEETLNRAEVLCQSGGTGTLDQPPEHLLDNAATSLKTGKPARGMIRQERDGRGVVLCFAVPEGQSADDGIQDRFRRVVTFLATGDLEAMGRLRYLYARPTDTGRTQLIRVWTDGPFNLYAMAHEGNKDTPGSDPKDAPRPPDSVRLLSATVEVAPYAVRIYETPRTPRDVAASYDREMPELGWKLLIGDGNARVYQRDDITVFVTPTEQEGRVLVSMLHMGSE